MLILQVEYINYYKKISLILIFTMFVLIIGCKKDKDISITDDTIKLTEQHAIQKEITNKETNSKVINIEETIDNELSIIKQKIEEYKEILKDKNITWILEDMAFNVFGYTRDSVNSMTRAFFYEEMKHKLEDINGKGIDPTIFIDKINELLGGENNDQAGIADNNSIEERFIADDEILYDWGFYIPGGIDVNTENYILLSIEPSGLSEYGDGEDHYEFDAETRRNALPLYENPYGLITLNIQLVNIRKYGFEQIAYFAKNTFMDESLGFLYRPDLQLVKIIDKAVECIREKGINVSNKVIIQGFSGGGIFAQRFALLAPEKVKAIVSGSGGGVMVLPEVEYNGKILNYPLGINDYKNLTGKNFNK